MKIGIIGTSPIMTILAIALSKKNEVTLFEKKKVLGGAWSFFKYKGFHVHNKTNVIVPLSKFEEKYVKEINKYFKKKFKIKIKKNQNIYKTIKKYKPKNVYKYEINKIYNHLRKNNIRIKNKEVLNMILNNKKIYLNREKFDKVYIPTYIGLNRAKINGKVFHFDYNKIISKHLIIISKKSFLDNFYYIENFNHIFDRVLQEKRKYFYLFTARIQKKFKRKSLKKLIKMSNFKIQKKDLLMSKIFNYDNCHRNYLQIKKLNKLNKFSQIKVIDTAQFVSAFKKLNLSI